MFTENSDIRLSICSRCAMCNEDEASGAKVSDVGPPRNLSGSDEHQFWGFATRVGTGRMTVELLRVSMRHELDR